MAMNKKSLINKKLKKKKPVDHLDVTESLGYQTYRKKARNIWKKEEDEKLLFYIDESLKKLGYSDGLDVLKSIKFKDDDFAAQNEKKMNIIKNIPWDDIATHFDSQIRKGKDLRKHWTGSLDPTLRKGKWVPSEDNKLLKAFNKHGRHWLNIAAEIPGRTEDQCAKRYLEVLRPDNARRLRDWALEEDLKLIQKVGIYGTKWRKISSEMDCRPSLTCRNRWRKIITMVVRSNAPQQIMKAVKENKNIDISKSDSNISLNKNKHNAKDNKKITNGTKTQADNKSLNHKYASDNDGNEHGNAENDDENEIIDKYDESESEDLLVESYEEQTSPNLNITSPNDTNILNEKDEISDKPTDSMSLSTQHNQGNNITSPMSHQKESLLLNHIASTFESLQSITDIKSPESAERGGTPYQDVTPISSLNSTNHESSKNIPKHVPNSSSMEWKFTLKDGKGLSISNGYINNSDLIRELIEQARKYSLQISIHQHIHNHYTSNSQESGQNSGIFNDKSFPIDNVHTIDREFDVFGKDFLSNSPDFDSLGLGTSNEENQDNNILEYNINKNSIGGSIHRSSSYVSKDDSVSSKGSRSVQSSDIRELGANRINHFNYLPPTIKPKLASSDSPQNPTLNKTPTSSESNFPNYPNKITKEGLAKRGESRRRRMTDGSLYSSAESSNSMSSIVKQSSRNTPGSFKQLSKTESYQNEEEGLDFWENLRTLAGNPSLDDSERVEDMDEAEDYGMFFDIIDNQQKSYDSPDIFHSNYTK
ncbi:hypothetical protein TPHA_0D04680 [Tetrapisispora phaffii CBS 4417]|uniref:Uncharacterized protein n=1 Tax=Tetrapisispora phaffii (strain ATCC 24235 / CBS 4417 / NBRC 1672 / NRRL Y-8282 / UCD 70-5) TaxID=1071381 RepID=G8BS26_TETPH|nr:hypothetical protein TPHA_0D04680 [Tetrapisispora phaffii CBS 4417]CCE63101.1 hypothetical protein TPHA_0D04680 [Tetrapisispora phaffii CBS 4417]